ncbi:MAG: transcriptional regulator, XRE family [Candidatus Kentron sp. G]|nr:MAG: transcriptional regulator, XRE family [Candidatus Kentron sp. G]VFN04655.1 MAG: transcriptional regulator, XRE family [Candidatus Kentron sp. G]VFN05841.1 MAG: transcriptional regulator, XRE family [Candidatus Kentron sp. G]
MSQVDTSITHITEANANIFEDLGFDKIEARKLKIKAELMCQLSEWIKEKRLEQEEVSELLQLTRPRISNVMRGESSGLTIDALVDMLERAGKHVTIQVI